MEPVKGVLRSKGGWCCNGDWSVGGRQAKGRMWSRMRWSGLGQAVVIAGTIIDTNTPRSGDEA